MDEKITFTPKCFLNDKEKLFYSQKEKLDNGSLIKGKKNLLIYENVEDDSLSYTTTILTEIPIDSIIDKLKNYRLFKEWCPYINDAGIFMYLDSNCDIIEMNKFRIIRFWLFDTIHHNRKENKIFYFFFKTIDQMRNFGIIPQFIINKAGFKISIDQDDLKKSVLTFSIEVKNQKNNSLFTMINKNICLGICDSIKNFLGMIKIQTCIETNKITQWNNYNEQKHKVRKEPENSLSGFRFLINYLLNLELTTKNQNDLTVRTVRKEYDQTLSIPSDKTLTNLKNNIILLKSYYEVKNEISSIYNDNYFSDNEIIRYVKGLKGDTSKIISALIKLDKFRKNLKENEIKQEEFDFNKFPFDKLAQILCLDIYMRPVIIVRLHYLRFIKEHEICDKIIRYLIWIFNKAIFLMPTTVDKYSIIVDCKNSSLDNFPDEYIKKLNEIFKNYYVKRLASIFIIKKGIMFSNMWNTVKSYLSESNLIKKIIIVKDYKQELSNIIPDDKLSLI